MPAYCRVLGYAAPQIGFELYLPLEGWNKKFLELGCSGHCGSTELIALCPLQKRYACIAADDGHKSTSGGALWGNENWQAKIDWGYRATHVIAQAGKAIIHRFYGAPPARSYFFGRSTGGRQALQEAQRFPWDFDGVVAIDPPPDLSLVYMTFAWGRRVLHDTRGEPLLGNAQLKLLSDTALAKCDLSDGVKDGVIGDPLHCSFDPSELACKPLESSGCLNPTQIDAIEKVYAGPTTSSGIRLIPGGPLPGSEFGDPNYDNGWRDVYLNSKAEEFTTLGLRYLFFSSDPGHGWTLRDFDFDRDYRRLGVMEVLYDATNPDLRVFKKAQGKLMIFQGLNDVAALPRSTIDYYEAIERMMGGRRTTQDFVRLFLIPGVDHGDIGPGAASIDYLKALEDWVEEDRPPDRLIAAHLKHDDYGPLGRPLDPSNVQFTRPIYPYPLRAKYKGTGNPADAASFNPTD